MKKLTKAIISSVCAAAMLAGAAMPASACDLTPEELFEKYAFAYTAGWHNYFGYYYTFMYNDEVDDISYLDADGNVCDYNSAVYVAYNEYCMSRLGARKLIYTCEYEDGFYYAVKDDGTAVIAGCDYDYLNAHTPTAINIPETIGGAVVTEIARHAFDYTRWDMKDLTSVSIPDTVEIIGTSAFYDVFEDGSICSINLPKSVKYLGNNAYGENTTLALGDVIVLPECTEFVNFNAFGSNPPLIQMPESLVFIAHPVLSAWGPAYVTTNEPVDGESWTWKERTDACYVDGKYNVVTLYDLRKYLIEKMEQQKPAGALTAGDLSANGEIDLSDAVLLARAVGGSYELSAEARAAADLNGDSTVDAADLTVLLNLLAGN